MRALVIMHVESEGPGVFGDLLAEAGVDVRTVRLHLGEALPPIAEVDAALTMGGPMNVYEEAQHPFLRDETRFLQQAAARGVPVLGVCLGAQMIAKAAGAPVTKNHVQEIGWSTVSLTAAGLSDPLFRGLPPELPVFQWHGDTFAIPADGALLATGTDCVNQALRHSNSWGLQFHVEADRALLASWFAGTPDEAGILSRHGQLHPEITLNARRLFANFLEFARATR